MLVIDKNNKIIGEVPLDISPTELVKFFGNGVSVEKTKQEITEDFVRKMNLLTSKYTVEEMQTWNTQETEAVGYIADKTIKLEMLDKIADGTPILDLAIKIKSKATFFREESGNILAWKNRETAKCRR